MTTKIYIAVEGTCTAGPDENLFEMMKDVCSGKGLPAYSERLQRRITGGATSLYVVSADGNYLLDSGDESDREILLKSLDDITRIERKDSAGSVDQVLITHNHPDHNANHDLFRNAVWSAEESDTLVELMLGKEENSEYNGFRRMYAGHRKRGITSDRFTPGFKLHNGIYVIDTPGHERTHKTYSIEDDEIVLINLETQTEDKAKRLVYVGDCFCDMEYLMRFLNGEPQKAVYGNAIPTEQWIFNNQEERGKLDQLNMDSMEKIVRILRKGDVLMFGHGGMIEIP